MTKPGKTPSGDKEGFQLPTLITRLESQPLHEADWGLTTEEYYSKHPEADRRIFTEHRLTCVYPHRNEQEGIECDGYMLDNWRRQNGK